MIARRQSVQLRARRAFTLRYVDALVDDAVTLPIDMPRHTLPLLFFRVYDYDDTPILLITPRADAIIIAAAMIC